MVGGNFCWYKQNSFNVIEVAWRGVKGEGGGGEGHNNGDIDDDCLKTPFLLLLNKNIGPILRRPQKFDAWSTLTEYCRSKRQL